MPITKRGGAPDADKLRELASWYREYAERAGSTVIWETRLRMAEDLEKEADLLEQKPSTVLAINLPQGRP